jgi:hypothetical protein
MLTRIDGLINRADGLINRAPITYRLLLERWEDTDAP